MPGHGLKQGMKRSGEAGMAINRVDSALGKSSAWNSAAPYRGRP